MSPRPVRVLHLRDSPWVDGPGRTILETASRIDRSRVDYHVGVFVASPGGSHPLVESLNSRGLPAHEILDNGGIGSELVDRVVSLIDELDIQLLHTSEFRSNVLGLLCRRRRPIRLVSTAHGWIANELRGKAYTLVDRVLLRSFDRVILVSYAMRRRLPRWWVPDSRISVLHNALMTDSYGNEVSDVPRQSPDPKGTVRILNVGRLSAEKGQAILIRAVASLAPDYPGLRLAFAGVGPLEMGLRKLSASLGINHRVDFLGYVVDMPALYAATDLVVQSSFTEGLPNVMLEAAHLGVPIVATDVGGTSEVIEHGVSGWLVEPNSQSGLEMAIRRFLQVPDDLVSMALAGRRRIESDFSCEVRTETQMLIYEDVVGKHQ